MPLGCIPLIIQGVASRWPAIGRWTREALQERFGGEEIACFVASRRDGTFLQQVNETRKMSFGAFLDHAFSESDEDEEILYLRIDSDHRLFGDLSRDFDVPPFLDGYNPGATGIWIGQKGNVTPFHHDWWHSFLAQISGKKRYTLVHPFEAKTLQESWRDAARYDLTPAPVLGEGDLPPGKISMRIEGVLEPGQILYIPPYWFHQVETLENGNISMPLRFDTRQAPDAALFQLSQDSLLRTVTNEKVSDDAAFVARMKTNRRRFLEKEEAFIEAYLETRDSDLTLDDVLERLDRHRE